MLAAVSIWRSGIVRRSSGIPFAVGFALMIPQFYGPAAVRIAHGVLVGAGLVWIAVALWSAPAAHASATQPATRPSFHPLRTDL